MHVGGMIQVRFRPATSSPNEKLNRAVVCRRLQLGHGIVILLIVSVSARTGGSVRGAERVTIPNGIWPDLDVVTACNQAGRGTLCAGIVCAHSDRRANHD